MNNSPRCNLAASAQVDLNATNGGFCVPLLHGLPFSSQDGITLRLFLSEECGINMTSSHYILQACHPVTKTDDT
jgi:hypothetical protein